MAMTTAGSGGSVRSEINVTPLIDILLVLLIVFMVIQQEMQRGLSVQLPAAEPTSSGAPESFVLSVRPGPEYELNRQPLSRQHLQRDLAAVFQLRSRRVLMIQADERARYSDVVRAIDASTGAGVQVIGLVPREAPTGS
jgi:biopolymer transport protein ExbD